MKLKLEDIRIDGGTQPRVEIDESLVAEYAEDMQDGDKFDPVIIFNDGANYWLADGFHRYFASKKVGYLEIEAEVNSGTKRDAILYSVGANSDHGLRRSNKDKRNAVMKLLKDEEWGSKSARWIADKCGVSDPFVGKMKKEVQTVSTSSDTVTGKDGKEYPASNSKEKESNKEPEEESTEEATEDVPDNVDPETGEVLGEEEETKEESRERKGIGLEKAHEAIAVLSRIPPNDDLLQEGYDIVIQWINRNR